MAVFADASPPLDAATEAAVGWLVTLNSGAVSAAEEQAFAQWLQAAPQHRQAWEALHGPLGQMLAPLRPAPGAAPGPTNRPAAGQLLGQTLARAESRTRRRRQLLRGALGVAGVALGTGLVADRYTPLTQLSADLRTGTGERRSLSLPDGSRLVLDARSAVDLDFGEGRRSITLRQGALLAQAAPRQPGQAPFVVHTAHGQVQALGTRFVVRLEADQTLVGMLEHRVAITTRQGQRLELDEGQSARFSAAAIAPADDTPATASAWQRGMLEAHDQPLGAVVQALRAYRPGLLRITPRAAALRVYGNYALDDTDRALAALAETLPITVTHYQGGWLVVIE